MMSLPKTPYAKSGDLHIAYQVTGQGPLDLVLVPGRRFGDRGAHTLKGVPEQWHLYAVAPAA
jgi:hypothetical protein